MNKLVRLLKLLAKIAQLELIPIKVDKILVKIIAVLDHLLRPLKLIVPYVFKDNFKIKTTNQFAKIAYLDNIVMQQNKQPAKMTVVLDRTLLLIKLLVLFVKKDSGKI